MGRRAGLHPVRPWDYHNRFSNPLHIVMSGELTRLQKVQVDLGEEPDDRWGPRCRQALALEIAASERRRSGNAPHINQDESTKGWGFTSRIDGNDVVVDNARMTCFGGSNDPQDSGETASGVSTKRNPDLAAVSLPMDGRMFAGLSKAEHSALDGSPIPRVPWRTIVRVTVGDKSFDWPVIDLGPGKRTGNALDLTIAAARQINPKATATNFEARGSYRVLGAAKNIRV
jgi:hypothetical protein